jgi:hypothetical protein
VTNHTYSGEFFSEYIAGSLQSARAMLPQVLKLQPAESVLDVGCGWGAWLHAAKELGVGRVMGVDGSYVDRAALLIEQNEFVACQLETEWIQHSLRGTYGRFDLTLCLEVAEHLPPEDAAAFVRSLTHTSDVVLFSAAIPFQGGTHHVNEQWPEYWALLFRSHGYVCCDCLRRQFWSNPLVQWWYSQNALLFVRNGSPAHSRLAAASDPGASPLSLVHPLNYIYRSSPNPDVDMRHFVSLSDKWLRTISSHRSGAH